jgi:hypothetical protein
MISPTHKRTAGLAPVRGSEFTTEVAPKGKFSRIFSWAKTKCLRSVDCVPASSLEQLRQ